MLYVKQGFGQLGADDSEGGGSYDDGGAAANMNVGGEATEKAPWYMPFANTDFVTAPKEEPKPASKEEAKTTLGTVFAAVPGMTDFLGRWTGSTPPPPPPPVSTGPSTKTIVIGGMVAVGAIAGIAMLVRSRR